MLLLKPRAISHLTILSLLIGLTAFAQDWNRGHDIERLGAANLDLIQRSPTPLDAEQLARLADAGFVITDDAYITFAQAYDQIYVNDLPVYISADALLYALHRSYDQILQGVEWEVMIPQLRELLLEMRVALRDGGMPGLDSAVRADADIYLTVASSLLSGVPLPCFGEGDSALVSELLSKIEAADGMEDMDLFGRSAAT